MFAKLLNRFAAVRGFGDQSHIGLGPNQDSNTLTDDRMIVYH
jgi:hypothetical protein